MVCETWKEQLDTYLDGELPSERMQAFDAHVRSCASCAADAIARMQMKRNVHVAGARYIPKAEFRRLVQRRIAARRRAGVLGFDWRMATAVATILVAVGLSVIYMQGRAGQGESVYSELTDLHVSTLASSSPVDVVSSDRHTVKPWFQGKIPFTFDLPELQNSEFSLVGGRVTYLEQKAGAHLIYRIRKHEISVFIFQQAALPHRDAQSKPARKLSFNEESWSQGGLRYYVLGDASAADIDSLAALLKRAGEATVSASNFHGINL